MKSGWGREVFTHTMCKSKLASLNYQELIPLQKIDIQLSYTDVHIQLNRSRSTVNLKYKCKQLNNFPTHAFFLELAVHNAI